MSDDWNLKGKKYSSDDLWPHHSIWDKEGELYFKKDIETLRKKLIEDFAKWHYDDIHGNMNFDDRLKQINKRFGVK